MSANVGDTVVALFDFQGQSAEASSLHFCPVQYSPSLILRLFSQDLPFTRADELKIVKISGDSNWWLAYHLKTKNSGMIPANYVVRTYQQSLVIMAHSRVVHILCI
jgi:hypothetical protein